MTDAIIEVKKALPALRLMENEPMHRHCSFKIGGPARAMAIPASLDELEALCGVLRKCKLAPLVMGNGTNLLVADGPLERFVIKLGEPFSRIERVGECSVLAESGITLAKLASFCADNALTGLEFAHGIPGTLGGAVSMNAGAYGGEMKDVLRSVKYIDENVTVREKTGDEINLSYRHSIFSGTGDIIVAAQLELRPGVPDEIRAKMRELSERRRASQPLDKPSAGSTFKRPATGYAAALIDEAGLKGFSIGGAQVSEKHAGFVVNRGGASFEDVVKLMEHIQKTVFDRTGIELEPEVKIIR